MSDSNTFNHKIDLWPVDDLIPYENNAKKHSKEQVKTIVNSIRRFGWTQPIVIWTNGEIIAGHGRRLAAIEIGMEKVPVIVRSDLTKSEADTLRLADNKVSSTEYDQSLMQQEIQNLFADIEDPGLIELGFSANELDFVNADLGEMNFENFEDDITSAVEQQSQENEQNVESTDESAAPVADALGFKRVKVAQSRRLRDLMTKITAQSDDPVEGMLAALERGIAAS